MKKNSRPGKSVNVFIGESSKMGCQLMTRALEQSCQRIRVVGSATDSDEILKDLGETPPDVAIISADLRDGPGIGLRVAGDVHTSYPLIHLIVLVHSADRGMIIKGFRAGADGVFCRDEPFEMLCKCIHAVYKGEIWARNEQLRYIVQEVMGSSEAPIRNAKGTKLLTKREEELAQLVAEGFTNRDISKQLDLTEHTVRNYMFRIFNKLGTSNRLELALYVIKQREDHGTKSSLGPGADDTQSFANSSETEARVSALKDRRACSPDESQAGDPRRVASR